MNLIMPYLHFLHLVKNSQTWNLIALAMMYSPPANQWKTFEHSFTYLILTAFQ